MGCRTIVFPTRVGVNRVTTSTASRPASIPHACGGEPLGVARVAVLNEYSPRVWG